MPCSLWFVLCAKVFSDLWCADSGGYHPFGTGRRKDGAPRFVGMRVSLCLRTNVDSHLFEIWVAVMVTCIWTYISFRYGASGSAVRSC